MDSLYYNVNDGASYKYVRIKFKNDIYEIIH